MRAGEIDRHLLCLHATHPLGFFNCFLDCFDGGIGIDDHAFAQAARFGFSHAQNFEQTVVCGSGNDTGNLARPDVQPDRVICPLCHLGFFQTSISDECRMCSQSRARDSS